MHPLATHVAELLRRAGFIVDKGVIQQGITVDLLAEAAQAGVKRRYAIECKDYQRPFNSGNANTVLRAWESSFLPREADELWVVTNEYTPRAKARFRKADARLWTFKELEEIVGGLTDEKRRNSTSGQNVRGKKVIKSVSANRPQILLLSSALRLLLDEKLAALRQERPNSEEAIANRDAQIADYENLRTELHALTENIEASKSHPEEREKNINKSVRSFSDGVRNWWDRGHEKICAKAYDMSMFLSAVTICSLAGAGGQTAVAVSAVLVGGKPVADALKGLLKRSGKAES